MVSHSGDVFTGILLFLPLLFSFITTSFARCDVDNPCVDGACCSKLGLCGLGPGEFFPLYSLSDTGRGSETSTC